MKLDSSEELDFESNPDDKILVVWFITKTITYAFSVMFFLLMTLFFINIISVVSGQEIKNDKETIAQISPSEGDIDDVKEKIEIVHPFQIILDYWIWAIGVFGVSLIIIQIYLYFLRRTYRYIITDKRCIFVGGILKRVERTVPHKKITDIQRSQNIVERALGIWNVQVFTPGTASVQVGNAKARAELNFNGLVNSEEVYESISRYAQLIE